MSGLSFGTSGTGCRRSPFLLSSRLSARSVPSEQAIVPRRLSIPWTRAGSTARPADCCRPTRCRRESSGAFGLFAIWRLPAGIVRAEGVSPDRAQSVKKPRSLKARLDCDRIRRLIFRDPIVLWLAQNMIQVCASRALSMSQGSLRTLRRTSSRLLALNFPSTDET